jgi:hypothetical protein
VALLVILLGVLLMIGGAAFLLLGFDVVMTERGAAMTMGGVTALSGGAVTLALGFALLRLSQILRALEGMRTPSGQVAAETATGPAPIGLAVGMGAAGVAAGATAALLPAGGAKAASVPQSSQHAIADRDPLADLLGEPFEQMPPPGPVAAAHDTDDADPAASKEVTDADEAREDAPAAIQAADDDPAAADVGAAAAGEPDDPPVDAGSEVAPADPEGPATAAMRDGAPTVLGSYRAGGRTYTMYSDGSVEAATEHGVERFDSMQTLREHLAKT